MRSGRDRGSGGSFLGGLWGPASVGRGGDGRSGGRAALGRHERMDEVGRRGRVLVRMVERVSSGT